MHFTGERLTGTARDPAELHDVRPADRDGLLRAVVAVLERDEHAVATCRADLLRRRDAATAALAFERAAVIQAEIDAVAWVLAPQQVIRPGAGDHDVHAWSGGVLVGFEIRDGTMCGWTQRPCSQAGARPLLRHSAVRWQPFADRAAHLAARLSDDAG